MRDGWSNRRKDQILSYIYIAHLFGLLLCAVVFIFLARIPSRVGQDVVPITWLGLGACLLCIYWVMAGCVHKNLLPKVRALDPDLVVYALLAILFLLAVVLSAGKNDTIKLLLLVPVIIAATARGRLMGTITAAVAGGFLLLSGLFLAPQGPGPDQVLGSNLTVASLMLLVGWLVGGLSGSDISLGGSIVQVEGKSREQAMGYGSRLNDFKTRLQHEMVEHRLAEDILQAQQHIYQAMLGALEEAVVPPAENYREIRTLADLTISLQRTGCEEVVAERVLQMACDITGAASGLYFRCDEQDHAVSLGSAAGMAGGLIPEVYESLQEIVGQRLQLSHPGEQGRNSLYLPDLSAEPCWRVGGATDIRSCYLAPLYYGERLFGFYVLLSNMVGGFPHDRQALADTLASFISSALENARLFGEAQRAYERLNCLQQQLFQAQKLEAVGQLAAGVAHEVNNQLTVIQACIDIYSRQQNQDEAVLRAFAKIRKAAQVSANLTRQLLLLGRRVPQRRAPIKLNQNVAEFRDTLDQVLNSSRITLKLDLAEDLWPVNADSDNIDQVVVNLAINARDAMPEGGTITIETRNLVLEAGSPGQPGAARPGRFVCLSVVDTGTGMDEQTLSRIFEPFFTTKAPGKGTGLGLAVAYGIVKGHEGWINVTSRWGQGSRFEIYLPAYGNEQP